MKIEIPDLGDFSDVEVIEVLVSEGDTVAKEDGLITLETDKAAMDVPAPADGRITGLSVKVGDKVSAGDVIGELDTGDAAGDGSDAEEGDEAPPAGDREEESDQQDNETDAAAGKPAAAAPAGEDDSAKAPQGKSHTVEVPDIGDFEDVDVIEVHVSAGDSVSTDDPLITLETDKAAMDVPATGSGTVAEVLVSVGDKVSKGSGVVVLETAAAEGGNETVRDDADDGGTDSDEEEQASPRGAETPPAGTASTPVSPTQTSTNERAHEARKRQMPPIDEAGFSKAHASPSVRKLARELGVDLASVDGSGTKGRILHDDVKAFVKSFMESGRAAGAALPEVPQVDFDKFGDTEVEPLTRIQKISGPRLQASWINLPHVTQHDLADITGLEAKRQELKGPAKERGISLTPLAFVMKACIAALKEFPAVNASLSADGTSLVYKKYYHLGFAADTEQGLVVPVIRDADRMDVYELAAALGELSAAAREGKLKAAQMQGASFTVSSLGGIGGTAFTPIVNAPEVAILGVSRAAMQPVWNGKEFEPRLMLPLSLSYDHRVIDGAGAVRFTTFLGETLGDVDRLLQAIP